MLFALNLDTTTMQATVRPLSVRGGAVQGSMFDLDITQFQGAAQFRPESLRWTRFRDLELTFSHAHPWPAPDLTQPPSAQNRADLGYTGRAVFLADLPANQVPGHTFFTDVVANTELVRYCDGYVQPGNLLAESGFNINCFPYVLLADDAEDNRVGLSNGENEGQLGPVSGNWDPTTGGWQRDSLPPLGDGWTGYDFVHAGQVVRNSIVFNASALTGTSVEILVAILIKYTEPKGSGGELGRTLRLPPATPAVLDFAYRAPHAAMDVSVVCETCEEPGFDIQPYRQGRPPLWFQMPAQGGAQHPIAISVRDWDALATEAATAGVGTNAELAQIEPGTAGIPLVEVHIPSLAVTPVELSLVADNATGKGFDQLSYTGTVVNSLAVGIPGQISPGLVRATDVEQIAGTGGSDHIGVDPVTLAADKTRITPITYQACHVQFTNPPKNWQLMDVDLSEAAGAFVDLIVEPHGPGPDDDRLAVAYLGQESRDLKIARATRVDPQSTADWTVHRVDSANESGYGLAIALHQNRLAVSYVDRALRVVRVARATTENPTQESDWTVGTLDTNIGTCPRQTCLAVDPTGRLVALYLDANPVPPAGSFAVRYARALLDAPNDPADWAVHSAAGVRSKAMDSEAAFNDYLPLDLAATPEAIYISSKPMVGNTTWSVGTALTTTPASAADWYFQEVVFRRPGEPQGSLPDEVRLTVHPQGLLLTSRASVLLGRARDGGPGLDWLPQTELASCTVGLGVEPAGGVLVGNRLTWVGKGSDPLGSGSFGLAVERALIDWPFRAEHWERFLVDPDAANFDLEAASTTPAVELNGQLALAYQRDGDILRVARNLDPW